MAPAQLLAATVLLAAPAAPPRALLPNASTIMLERDEIRRIPAPGRARFHVNVPLGKKDLSAQAFGAFALSCPAEARELREPEARTK